MGRSRGPQLDQDVQEAAHMLAEGCGTPVSAAVSAALDAQRAPGVPGGSDPRTGAGERGHRHAAQRDPAVIPHSARNSLFWLDPAEDNAQ